MLIPAREVKPIAGKIYVVSHEFGTIYARFEDVGKIYKAPTVSAQFDKKLSQANAKKNAASLLDVARWAIQRGLPGRRNECAGRLTGRRRPPRACRACRA